MKKYLICLTIVITSLFFLFFSHYIFGFYIPTNKPISSFTSSDQTNIYVNNEIFTIKGVNLGASIPGYHASDFAIDKNTYKNWFKQIQDMGANTIRVYTVNSPDFYKAFYEYNKNNENPLYLIHGIWLDDYTQNSRTTAYDNEYREKLLEDTKTVIDIIHGRKYLPANDSYSNGLYTKNISKWVLGYIIGTEWDSTTVAYTNNQVEVETYHGKYLSAKEDATTFMNVLAYVGDQVIEYESTKYNQQRLVSFANSAATDPFIYSMEITNYFKKCAEIDVEYLEFSDEFIGGTFASYNVYPYYPDYLNYEEDKSTYVDSTGKVNTYYAYLKKLTDYHSLPVIITEFGISTGRGIAQKDMNTNYNQGNMTEKEQGQAIISMYSSIMEANCNGGIVYNWQDEWYKKTWNTMQNVNTNFAANWSDAQTSDQFFGLLSFDPGKEKSISYVDGDISEWTTKDIVIQNGAYSLSMKYDEKYIYLFANVKNYDNTKKLYIPIDTTQKSGSKTTNINNQKYSRDIDFLIEISGTENSRVYVHEYYDALLAMFSENIAKTSSYIKTPKVNSKQFNNINLILQTANTLITGEEDALAEVHETGKLQYGNANPESPEYNSIADYIINGDYIEIRIPWQLLNFSNPSKMMIHDNYYEHYGVEEQQINKIYLGIGTEIEQNVNLRKVNLEGWETKVTYHERLKQSYYVLQNYWTSGDVK